MIQKGDRSKLDAEILKQLLKLLPEDHEVSIKCVVLMEFSVFCAQLETLALLKQEATTRSHICPSSALASPCKG